MGSWFESRLWSTSECLACAGRFCYLGEGLSGTLAELVVCLYIVVCDLERWVAAGFVAERFRGRADASPFADQADQTPHEEGKTRAEAVGSQHHSRQQKDTIYEHQ